MEAGAFAALIYFLYCIYGFHKVAQAAPGWWHPITPARAVGFHFIPVYYLYWMFKWPLELGRFLRWCMPNPGINWQLGFACVASQLLFLVDRGAGALATASLCGYVRWRMKIALEFKAASLASRASSEALSA